MWFETPRVENLKQWHEKQLIKKTEQLKQLEESVAHDTLSPKDLPFVILSSDKEGQNKLTNGLQVDKGIITLSWTETTPEQVFSGGKEYKLAFNPHEPHGIVVYQENVDEPLPIANLSYFGKQALQLVQPSDKSIILGEFNEGQFSIYQRKIEKLKAEIASPENPKIQKKPFGNRIALLKSNDHYLPVAFYDESQDSIVYLEQISNLNTQVSTEKGQAEKYYVLENDYQQLVFSNVGGALMEINLPFRTDKNDESIVKEIGFDRDIQKQHPYNALFPSVSYFTPGETPVAHSKGKEGGYYPLLRRNLIQSGKRKSIRILPEYYALNIVSQYPELAELNYEVTHFDSKSIVFEGKQRNRKIIKTYSFENKPDLAPYVINLTIKVEGDSKGLWLTSGVPEVEWISNGPAPALKYRLTRNEKSEVNIIDLPEKSTVNSTLNPDWICNSNGFLGMIVDPLTKVDPGFRTEYIPGTVVPSRLVQIDEAYDRFDPKDLPGYMLMLPLNSAGGEMKFRIFAGPFAGSVLNQVDSFYSDPETHYNPDYIGSQTFHGYFTFISAPISKFLLILMNFFYYLTHSWAFSIVLLTVALRIMLYPLNSWSTKSMLKMQTIAPEVTKIQEKYKKDPKKAQLEIMNLYKESGVNPLSGCFPLLIQMPFLIGMFDLLKSTFELRGASFIPGWIDDLAAPDVLFSWQQPIFFIGTEFHLLPILLGVVMLAQQRLMSTAPKDVSQMTEQQRQQKAMGNIMTVIFAVMFYNFPAGLNIYWLSSMLLGILQQWFNARQLKPKLNPNIIDPRTKK
jgi:YidC/Oxa1 family membrane protein insertase